MNDDKTTISDLQSINIDTTQSSCTQSRTSDEYFRRKLLHIIASTVVAVLFMLAIAIPTVIVLVRRGNTQELTVITTATVTTTSTSTTTKDYSYSQWMQNGITIAGGNGDGNRSNQLSYPGKIYIHDDNQTIYIADGGNHRIVEWKYGASNGQVVAGGNGRGSGMNQLNTPSDVTVDKNNDSLIICDSLNKRVVRWFRRDGISPQIIIDKIDCYGLIMDDNGDLYVGDNEHNEVKRWRKGETKGILVAGGNGKGNHVRQLNFPTYFIVDQDQSLYISDGASSRVVKWLRGATEGIVIAGGQGYGDSLSQFTYPYGVILDHLGHIYVADYRNPRIMRWLSGSRVGSIAVGGNEQGNQSNQFKLPMGLSLDWQGNLYVADYGNHRIQKFVPDIG